MVYHVLNLGAGVQSTALALLAAERKIQYAGEPPVELHAAVFADTGEEPEDPGHSVYTHLEWLRKQLPFPIVVRSAGRLGEHLMHGKGSTKRFASIPAFTLSTTGKVAKVRRQCTAEYKVDAVEQAIRRDILGLKPRQRIPRGVTVIQYMGISVDEAGRMLRAKKRLEDNPVRWSQFRWPLIEQLVWTRADCRAYLAPRVPHRVPRSACVFCPFHANEEWAAIRARGGADWARALEVDRALRTPGMVVNRQMTEPLFLHRSCRPLDEVDFTADTGDSMAAECQGMCGS